MESGSNVFGLLMCSKCLVLLQRRSSLEEWMGMLLSDINLSRSVPVASFLELEAAARSCRCLLNASICALEPSVCYLF